MIMNFHGIEYYMYIIQCLFIKILFIALKFYYLIGHTVKQALNFTEFRTSDGHFMTIRQGKFSNTKARGMPMVYLYCCCLICMQVRLRCSSL